MIIYVWTRSAGFDLAYQNTAVMYAALVIGALYSMEQAWTLGYLRRWYEPVISFIIISVIGFVPTFIPFLNTYYDVVPLTLNTWVGLYVVGMIGFVFYFLIQKIIVRRYYQET
jgi:hypothetical protein